MEYLGLDVSKKFGHIARYSEAGEEVENKRIELEVFALFLQSLGAEVSVALEYSGRLAEPWIELCIENSVAVYIMHCAERKALNRIQRQRGKTDPRDARALAQTLYQWKDPQRRKFIGLPNDLMVRADHVRIAWQLRTLLACADQAVSERTKAKQRSEIAYSTGSREVGAFWEVQACSKQPEEAQKLATNYCQKHFPHELEALTAIPGLGDRTATRAIATLCPASRFPTSAKAKAYIGIDPTNFNSGGKELEKPHMSHRGNKELRSLLFMCALSQVKANNDFGELYRRLVANGKHHNVALIAVCAKYLRVIHAVLLRIETGGTSHEASEAHSIPPKATAPTGYVIASEYARLKGVSRQAISKQVLRGTLETVTIEGKRYVKVAIETPIEDTPAGSQVALHVPALDAQNHNLDAFR